MFSWFSNTSLRTKANEARTKIDKEQALFAENPNKIKKLKRQEERTKRYDEIKDEIIQRFQNIHAKFDETAQKGEFKYEILVSVKNWSWEQDEKQSPYAIGKEQNLELKHIVDNHIRQLTPKVYLTTHCPHYEQGGWNDPILSISDYLYQRCKIIAHW